MSKDDSSTPADNNNPLLETGASVPSFSSLNDATNARRICDCVATGPLERSQLVAIYPEEGSTNPAGQEDRCASNLTVSVEKSVVATFSSRSIKMMMRPDITVVQKSKSPGRVKLSAAV